MLLTEPRLLALAAGDPLAARTSLRLADLAGRALPDGSPALQGGRGSPPAGALRRALDLAELFTLIEVGEIVWFPPLSLTQRHPRPGVAYRPVEDLTASTLVLAWLTTSRSPAIAAFAAAASSVAAPSPSPTASPTR